MNKCAIIIGAGPAGLTAAYELITKTDIKPIIIEKTSDIGGISKTVVYNGNRMDIGGHRFFSKSDTVMKWWQEILPIQGRESGNGERKTAFSTGGPDPVSRFGKELYETFFKDYTKKIWGVPCNEIAADWGAQRIKELSVSRTLLHEIKSLYNRDKSIEQKNTDTSLIMHFMYPKLGPGQMWETVAKIIEERGGVIIKNAEVTGLKITEHQITELTYYNRLTDTDEVIKGDYYFSTMPVKDLINAMGSSVPAKVKQISNGLPYRDSITVGLLLNELKIKNETTIPTINKMVPDNWIYIQERDVKMARLQIFNNWSPYLVVDPTKVWIGLEYCCNEGDELWKKKDSDFIQFAIDELHHIDIIDKNEVVDCTMLRTLKTYPAYFGTYLKFNIIRDFTDSIDNLFLIGRNGMHKYYNQDHAMLTAIIAVNNIISEKKSKNNIWRINADEEYIESENE